MNIELGYNPTPSTNYFISVGLNKNEWISFDNTTKGFRVIKQILSDKKFNPAGNISGEWDDIVLKDGKYIGRNHVVWQDFDEYDVVNGETWKTVWEKPISNEDHEKLLDFSRFIADNLETLDKYKKQMDDFEALIKQIVKKYQ
jgi:hypothetical protein